MQAERDYLANLIFAQLRKLCERRPVVRGEVDIRWGVTFDQAGEAGSYVFAWRRSGVAGRSLLD